jgi:hypothetical protein
VESLVLEIAVRESGFDDLWQARRGVLNPLV